MRWQPSTVHRKAAAVETEDEKTQAGGVARAKACAIGRRPSQPVRMPTPASPATAKAIGAVGAGRPLASAERAFFEPRFGADFSRGPRPRRAAADRASRRLKPAPSRSATTSPSPAASIIRAPRAAGA